MNFVDKIAKFFGYEKTRAVQIFHLAEEPRIPTCVEDTHEQPVETPPDISEPIIKIVELMESNPKRFEVLRKIQIDYGRDKINITDKVTKLTVELGVFNFYGDTTIYSNTDWVTKDESKILYEAAQVVLRNQNERIKRVKEWQHNRKRNKWVEIYCGENN